MDETKRWERIDSPVVGSFRIFKFCLQTVPSIAKESNVAELIFVTYRITWHLIHPVHNRHHLEVKHFFELHEIWPFHTLSVVEIDYHVRYSCSVANYFNSRLFVFTLECSVFTLDSFTYSTLKLWLDFVIIDTERLGGILLTPSVSLGMKHLRKSSDSIEVVLIQNNFGVSFREKWYLEMKYFYQITETLFLFRFML